MHCRIDKFCLMATASLLLSCQANESKSDGCAASADDLAQCVDASRYERDLRVIAAPRPPGSAHWQQVQDLCRETFASLGLNVTVHKYKTGVNILGELKGTTKPDELVLITAHYDHIENCAGADDNATGVAGVLEAARVMAQGQSERSIVFACWDEEEAGLVGSSAWAQEAKARGDKIAAVFNFEMIGYASTKEDSQSLPVGFDLLFPTPVADLNADKRRGDFIAVVADSKSTEATQEYAKQADKIDLDVMILPVPDAMLNSPLAADLQRSDHASFWAEGYPAIMITDTANFRNKAYHCRDGEDTVDRLNIPFATKVVGATLGAAGEMADWSIDGD